MEPAESALQRERSRLQQARAEVGQAAYSYFFLDSTEDTRAAYLAALEAEADAQMRLDAIVGKSAARRPGPPVLK